MTERVYNMIKSDLMKKIAEENPHLYYRDIEKIINLILNKIVLALENGQRVELRGFGAFAIKKRYARLGRNPKTGTKVDVKDKFVPYFKSGKALRQKMNEV